MTVMDITIHQTLLPHDDPDASLAFYRDTLGFEVRNDVGYGGMRWITVGPADQPDTSIVLYPPFATPGITDDERRTIAEMMAKGSYAIMVLATADLDGAFAQLQASGAEVVQEPIEQPYGIRDCAIRDPAAYFAILRLYCSFGCTFGSTGTNCANVSRTRAFGDISAGAWTLASAFKTGGTMVGWVVSNTMACGHLWSERILKVGFSVATTLFALAPTGCGGA